MAIKELRFNDHLIEGLVSKAIAMRPLLERSAPMHELDGKLTQEVVDELSEAGIFRMTAPERVGGLSISSYGQARVYAELARGCPSTAWVVSIINSAVWFGSVMPFEMQDYLFKNGVPRLCSPTNGTGTLVPEGDHFVLNGRWSYGSGSHHSKWALVPANSPSGALNFVALPMEDATIVHTWEVAGMKGTGSDTVVAENVKVKLQQFCEIPGISATLSLDVLPDGPHPDEGKAQLLEATDYWIGATLLRAKMLGVMFGTVQGLMEQVLKTRGKGLWFTTYEHREESQVFQAGIGEAFAKLTTVRSIIDHVTAFSDKGALEGRELSLDERVASRSQVIVAIEILIEVTDKLMSLYGSSGYASACPAQRFWRDFSVGSRHAMFSLGSGYELAGKHILGIEPNISPPTVF